MADNNQGAALSKPPGFNRRFVNRRSLFHLFKVLATRQEIITYWLCPAEPARSYFSEIIRGLAARFDAPIFEPHVTIFVTSAEKENPGEVLAKVLRGRPLYRLSVLDLSYSDKFTQTLFIRFGPHIKLGQLSEDLRSASAAQSDYELDPHLSLLYKTMDSESKRELAGSITLPIAEVLFDTVKAVLSPARIESRADVEGWRIVAEEKLRQ